MMQSAEMKSADNVQASANGSPDAPLNMSHISTQEIAQMTPEDVDQLAQRLEQDEYSTPFEGLQDWHKLRAVAFQRSELVEPYIHLLDLEAFDES